MIESAANAKFKRIQKLMKQARARKKEGVFVVEGWKICLLYTSDAADD